MELLSGVFFEREEARGWWASKPSSATSRILCAFGALPPITQLSWTPLVTEWAFALGREEEGLNTSLNSLPPNRVMVSLPQRSLHPDTPYWYVTNIAFIEDAVLEIGADDGAQVYLERVRIPVTGEHFFVPSCPNGCELIVRVLNKAVYGGLEWVRFVGRTEFERQRMQAEFRKELSLCVHKFALLREPSDEQIGALQRAIEIGSLEALHTAQETLSALPCCVVGPLLQKATTHSISVLWETDVPCIASLLLGTEDEPIQRLLASSEGTLHVVELTDLQPNTTYTYRILNGPLLSAVTTFCTLPSAGGFAFTAWADPQVNAFSSKNRDVFAQNVNLLRSIPVAFTVGVGDLVENGNQKEPWLYFFERLSPLASRVPTMLVGGNHEYDGCFEDLRSPYLVRYLRGNPTSQYFAWSVGNARCVALDPNSYYPTGIPVGSAAREWFLQELESSEWRLAKWHFLFIHQPPFSQGWLDYEGDIPIRKMLEPLFSQHQIDFVISGHTHDYEHLERVYGEQRVHFLVLGGAGGGVEAGGLSAEPVMDQVIRRHHIGHFVVEAESVRFCAIATDTRVLDSFVVQK